MSSIKSFLYDFVIGSMIFFITTQIMSGIQLSGILTHWLMMFAVFVVANMIVPHTLKFFTLPKNFLTYWLGSAVVSFAAIYAMSLFLPGIIIGETLIDPVSLGIISVNTYTLSADITMVIAGIIAGLFTAILFELNRE